MDKLLSRLYSLCAFAPLVFLALLLGLQTIFALDARAMWFSDEIRYANVFEHVIHAGKWLVMYLNGVPYPDKPPVYFWFLTTLLPIFKGATPALFMAGAALSGLLFLTATMGLSRYVLRGGRELSLAAGLVLLTCFYFVGLTHYSRMDLLFAALITASHICLYKGFERDRAMGLILAGFALAAVATLTKGPLGLVFPLLTSVVFLAWRGNLRRLIRRDVGLGLLLCLGILGAWVAGAWVAGEHELIKDIFYKQIYRRAVNASHHEQPFWHYFATLPAAWAPWTLLIFVLPLRRLIQADFWGGVMAKRKTGDGGTAFLWIQALSGFILLSSLSTKIIVYLMPLFPALALLTAKTLLGLDDAQRKRLWLCIGGIYAFIAVSAPFANFAHPWPMDIKGLWPMAGACAVVAAGLWFGATRLSARAGLLVFALLFTAWTQPLTLVTLPSLDPAMSPKAQAQLMGQYIDDGYTPVAYKIYSGVYTYYSGHNILETQDLPLIETMVRDDPKLVLGIQKKYWDRWENRPDGLRIVHEQWVTDRPYVLAVKGPKPDYEPNPPAPATEQPSE